MAQDKKFAKNKKFSQKNENSKGKKPENKQKSNEKTVKKPEKKHENKGDFTCKDCGGILVRRYIFPSSEGKPYTLLRCESCGTETKPRDIRYQDDGFVWGTKIKKAKPEKKAS